MTMYSVGDILKRSGFGKRETGGHRQNPNISASNCENCKRQGACGIWVLPPEPDEDGYMGVETTVYCSKRYECKELEEFHADWVKSCFSNSGMPNELRQKTVNAYMANEPWQQLLKAKAVEYITSWDRAGFDEWLMLSGQSGSGKTHLCAAICNKLMNDGKRVKYVSWLDLMRSIKAFNYGPLDEAKNAKILFLDDMYKGEPTREEMKATYELIEYRYSRRLVTIVTTERTSNEMIDLDEAITGRIVEMCGNNWAAINRNAQRNWRTATV